MKRLFNFRNIPLRATRRFGLKGCLLLFVLVGCQKLKPEAVSIPEYPNFKELMEQQVSLLTRTSVEKKVWLEEESETKQINMDSTKWAEELSFLKEVNPNQPEYVGAFEKSVEGELQVLTLGMSESGPLKKVKYLSTDGEYQYVEITLHEDKDVYLHHRDIAMNFKNGVLNSMQINGYQKMMFKDTVRFGIALSIK